MLACLPRYRVRLALALSFLAAPAAAQGETEDRWSAIVLEHHTHLTLEQDGRIRQTVRIEVEVQSPAGQDPHGVLVLGHDTFRKIRKLEGQVTDAEGNVIRKLRRDAVRDYPATASYSLYEDNRVQVAELYHDAYPYRVVWNYEVDYEGALNWPVWRPQRGAEPVRHASLTVTMPKSAPLRFQPHRLPFEPTEQVAGGRTVYRWEGALPARAYEPLGPSGWDQAPMLYLATDHFTVDGHAGSLASWSELGAWYDSLARGRGVLPEQARAEVLALTAGIDEPRERARIIYDHLQQTVRYVSVQLGIGGWQPFPADYVYERRYGDCKALTNYLAALLAAADVASFPALIGHDRPDLDPDFPRNAFNHVVLLVPLPDGELWLEATSQTIPFGYLGSGSEDRWALVVEHGSGRLARTPASGAADNRRVRHAEVQLAASGNAVLEAETQYTGHPLSHLRSALAQQSEEEQRTWWEQRLGFDTTHLHIAQRDDPSAEAAVRIAMEAELPKHGTSAGSRLIFRPNVFDRWTTVPPEVVVRTQDVEFDYPFMEVDTVRFALPHGFAVEALPEPVVLEVPFGRYEARAQVEGDAVVYARYAEVSERRVPPGEYAAYRDFVLAVVRADDAQIVLKRR